MISRDGSHIQSFEMEVPNNKSLNVGTYFWLSAEFANYESLILH